MSGIHEEYSPSSHDHFFMFPQLIILLWPCSHSMEFAQKWRWEWWTGQKVGHDCDANILPRLLPPSLHLLLNASPSLLISVFTTPFSLAPPPTCLTRPWPSILALHLAVLSCYLPSHFLLLHLLLLPTSAISCCSAVCLLLVSLSLSHMHRARAALLIYWNRLNISTGYTSLKPSFCCSYARMKPYLWKMYMVCAVVLPLIRFSIIG